MVRGSEVLLSHKSKPTTCVSPSQRLPSLSCPAESQPSPSDRENRPVRCTGSQIPAAASLLPPDAKEQPLQAAGFPCPYLWSQAPFCSFARRSWLLRHGRARAGSCCRFGETGPILPALFQKGKMRAGEGAKPSWARSPAAEWLEMGEVQASTSEPFEMAALGKSLCKESQPAQGKCHKYS